MNLTMRNGAVTVNGKTYTGDDITIYNGDLVID